MSIALKEGVISRGSVGFADLLAAMDGNGDPRTVAAFPMRERCLDIGRLEPCQRAVRDAGTGAK